MIQDAETCLKGVSMPQYYSKYHREILKSTQKSFELATKARKLGLDISDIVEPKIAYDLAHRVAKMHNIDIADRLRALLSHTTKEKAALKIAEEIAIGEYGMGDAQTRLNNAVRVSLAIVTEGVTVAPLQGIADVKLKNNLDGTQYLSISFAGPIRSAGGTEAALTMLIADHARRVINVDKYVANSYDDETGRFVEELRIYEREVGNFQFKVLDEDVIKCIMNLPVELDGMDTDPVEVAGHRGMKRISTNRVRGGALRVMNDGLIGRSRKLLNLVETLKLDGWNWLKELKGAVHADGDDDDAVQHRMSEVITGRPVLSMTKKIGGFRLRYGRCYNTGFATVGIHPAVPTLLNDAIVVGTQIKMDMPGKASTIALVDNIEPPIVRLSDGSVLQISTTEQAVKMQSRIEKILYLGDILISYGDFLENNAHLPPTSYVEEIWALQLHSKLLGLPLSSLTQLKEDITRDRLIQLSKEPFITFPTVDEAFKISKWLNMPLHPKYSFYWDSITIDEILLLKKKFAQYQQMYPQRNGGDDVNNISSFSCLPNDDPRLKDILERLGIFHSISNENKIIKLNNLDQIHSLTKLLLFEQAAETAKTLSHEFQETDIKSKDAIEYISKTSGVEVKPKFASSIAVRVGRPEKAAERKMKPPVHVLFPIGSKGGVTRDILKAAKDESFYTELSNRFCHNCSVPSIGTHCRNCGGLTPLRNLCIICRDEIRDDGNNNKQCYRCGKEGKTYSPTSYPLQTVLEKAHQKLDIKSIEPFKGVKALMNKDKAAEPLEKGILRQKYSLYVFKDGTIRFDATNEPLTHFKPRWTMVSIEKLRELGYNRDYLGIELMSTDQLIELLMQDVIIPLDAAKHLLNAAKFIDEELVKLYGFEPFYNASSLEDLIGHLIVGLAPHTSVGIIGRIIGFTDSQVCLASPIWHSAKRRDCDGDADSIILLMDAFLNFAYGFLPDKIGGLMDAPLLIQPVVLPYEVQRQAHNIDVVPVYPLEFYEATWKQLKAGNLVDKIELIKNRIGTENQFFSYAFTHSTGLLTTNGNRSAYSRLNTMEEKLDMQISTAKLINAVDPDEVVSMVLMTHILPDIMGNMRSYSSQSFRCSKCGEKYRRMPLMGKCIECKNELSQTVTRGSVEKYIGIASDLCNRFKVNDYLRSRVESLTMELKLIFKEQRKEQSTLVEFMS
jgi:DNA polymerase II large subunit